MAEHARDELIEQMRDQDFPGRKDLLDWLQAHPEVQLCSSEVPEEQSTKAADARRIWEIRIGSTRRAGLQTYYMEDAVRVLKEVEETEPDLPIMVTSARGADRLWFILSARGRWLSSFSVERRSPAPNVCRSCGRQLPPATLEYAIARIREIAAGVHASNITESAGPTSAEPLRERLLLLADELEGLCASCNGKSTL